uniref:Uncharacterized protein n=1 Tax=Ciona intestinalis TaxID=7719 RepID=H2XPH9_CIOIN
MTTFPLWTCGLKYFPHGGLNRCSYGVQAWICLICGVCVLGSHVLFVANHQQMEILDYDEPLNQISMQSLGFSVA